MMIPEIDNSISICLGINITPECSIGDKVEGKDSVGREIPLSPDTFTYSQQKGDICLSLVESGVLMEIIKVRCQQPEQPAV